MIKAFVFGKFLPFHKGHEAMIRFALGRCDWLTVLVCCSNQESVSGATRKSWIEGAFADSHHMDVRVYNYSESELPNTSVPSREVSKVWAAAFKALLPDYALLVTSEAYGAFVAAYMQIRHLAFDLPRTQFPVAATAIRNDLFANWHFLPDSVKRDFALKVVVLGTESTGKSTLAENLARHFSCSLVRETGRELIADSNTFSIDDLTMVAREHARRIDRAVPGGSPLVVIDTDIHITKSYCRFAFGTELQVDASVYAANRAQLHLYLSNDVAFHQDGTRLDEPERNRLDAAHRQELAAARIPYVEISGSWTDRFAQAVGQVEQLIAAAAKELMPLSSSSLKLE